MRSNASRDERALASLRAPSNARNAPRTAGRRCRRGAAASRSRRPAAQPPPLPLPSRPEGWPLPPHKPTNRALCRCLLLPVAACCILALCGAKDNTALMVLLLMLPYNNLLTADTTTPITLHCMACLLEAWPVQRVFPRSETRHC